jgi:mannitol-1-phosphate 5-dehydrogenase
MYGAGNIGRGFIGPLFAQAGYEVIFVDIDPVIIHTLNEKGSYTLQVMAQTPYCLEVKNVRGIDGNDTDAVIQAIAECDIMAVSLGSQVLPKVSSLLGQGFAARQVKSRGALDILICENLKDAAALLRSWIHETLAPEWRGIMDSKLGLVETAIGRMVPLTSQEKKMEDPLYLQVEEYDFLPVDRTAFRSLIPPLPQLVPYAPFSFYEERKLYLHNMGHAVCAYLGLLGGYEYIWQAIGDAHIRLVVQNAMGEAAAMLAKTYDISYSTLQHHVEDLIIRFANPALGDTCARVARDPLRKIAAEDRLVAPLRRCTDLGIHPSNIAMGLAAALLTLHSEEDEAAQTLHDICLLPKRESHMVLELFCLLKNGIGSCIAAIDWQKRDLRGKIV